MSATQTPDSAAETRRINRRNAKFARGLQVALGAYLGTEITVGAQPARREARAETAAADINADFHAAGAGHDSTLVLRLACEAIFPVLEVLLGGAPETTAAPNREITEIERQLLLDFLTVVAQQFDRFWSLGLSGPLRALGDEHELARALPAEDQLLVLPVQMKLGSFVAPISLIPGSPSTEASPTEPVAEPLLEDAQRRLLERMKGLALTFEVQAEDSTVALRDLCQLKAGQVLILDHPVDRPLTCRINQSPQLSGRIVRSGNWRAFRLQAPPA